MQLPTDGEYLAVLGSILKINSDNSKNELHRGTVDSWQGLKTEYVQGWSKWVFQRISA